MAYSTILSMDLKCSCKSVSSLHIHHLLFLGLVHSVNAETVGCFYDVYTFSHKRANPSRVILPHSVLIKIVLAARTPKTGHST